MNFWGKRKIAVLLTLTLCLVIAAPASRAAAEGPPPVRPGGGEMLLDAVVLRPLGVLGGLLGGGVFILSLPFTAASSSVEQAFDVLVEDPIRYTFERPLGHFTKVPHQP